MSRVLLLDYHIARTGKILFMVTNSVGLACLSDRMGNNQEALVLISFQMFV